MSKSVLFVCFGNTCRSPMAEACFKELLRRYNTLDCFKNWFVDSAGTSTAQLGAEPNSNAQKCMKLHNVYHHVSHHRSRQVTANDLETFDYIFTMDKNNMKSLRSLASDDASANKIQFLASFEDVTSQDPIIEDPYGSSVEVYEETFEQCWRCCENFLKSLLEKADQ